MLKILSKLNILKGIFEEKMQRKINSLKNEKQWYLIHTLSDKAFKGTVVNQTLPSLHGGSFGIDKL